MNCCLQKFTTHQFTYFIYYDFQGKFKYPKIIKIQQLHQEIHVKQIFIILFELFSIGDSFNLKHSIDATDLVTRQHDSRENAKDFVVTSPHLMPHPIVSRIANANLKRDCEHVTRTEK